jgi:PAS domain S-box-containing protein
MDLEKTLSHYMLHWSIERDRLNHALQENERLLTTALESSDAGLWDWSVGNDRIFFSASYYIMLGYAPFERPEASDAWIDYIHPEDTAAVRRKFSEVIEYGEERFELEFRAKTQSGEYYQMLCRGKIVERGQDGRPQRLVGMVVNISDKVRWEEILQESERRLSTLLDSLPGMAYRCIRRDQWVMEFVSQGCVELTGYTPEELTGSRELYTDLIHPEDRNDVWRQVENAIAKQQPYQMFYRIKTVSGEDRWVWEQGTGVFGKDRQLIAIEGFTADVTAYKRVEEELQKENVRLKDMMRDGRHRFGKIIGKSPAMQKVYEFIIQAASSSVNVIVYGESGTGKELVAHAIHDMSERSHKEFVAVNCGAIPDNLLESEFFGYKKGAFTGANIDKLGYLDIADGGTLFLDEIGEINLNMQVKLLRAIEGGGYTPIGDRQVKRPDIRIIAATNRDLKQLVRQGAMRQDFFYRIHILPIRLPPLRERRSDIPLLIYHFLQMFSDENQIATMPEDVIQTMQAHEWSGNVRELQNMVQRYLTVQKTDFLSSQMFEMVDGRNSSSSFSPQHLLNRQENLSLKIAVRNFEKEYITAALTQNNGNRTHTARMLGIGLRTLQRKINEYHIE